MHVVNGIITAIGSVHNSIPHGSTLRIPDKTLVGQSGPPIRIATFLWVNRCSPKIYRMARIEFELIWHVFRTTVNEPRSSPITFYKVQEREKWQSEKYIMVTKSQKKFAYLLSCACQQFYTERYRTCIYSWNSQSKRIFSGCHQHYSSSKINR